MGDASRQSRLKEVVADTLRTIAHLPFTYVPGPPYIASWKRTFGSEGGCLDTGEAGIKIDVQRILGQRSAHNRRKVGVQLYSEQPIRDTDRQMVASPPVLIKQKNFSENDKIILKMPVHAKVKKDDESQEKAELVVMCQNVGGKSIEEVPEKDWVHSPEASTVSVEIRKPLLKTLIFAVFRCIEGKIWKYVQITMQLSLYGPPQLEQNMCLHAMFSCKSTSRIPPHTCQATKDWTHHQIQISKHQTVQLKVEIQNNQTELWEIDNSKVDAISKEDMRGKQSIIQRTVPVTFDPGSKPEQMKQFMLSLTMFATEDGKAHHHSCMSPPPTGLSEGCRSSGETAASTSSGLSQPRRKGRHLPSRSSSKRKHFHGSCAISCAENPLPLSEKVQAVEDFTKHGEETRENLLNLKKGEFALVLGSTNYKARRQGRSLTWNIGMNNKGEIGFFANELVKSVKTAQSDEIQCTSQDILSFIKRLCSSTFLQIDDSAIHTCLAHGLGSKWVELARVEKMSIGDIDAINEETRNEKNQGIRLAEKIKMKRGLKGCHGYLPSLVCDLLMIGLRKLAITIVINTLLYTVAKTTIGRWEDFEKELQMVSTDRNINLCTRKVAGSKEKDFDHALAVLKRGYNDRSIEFLECLQITLSDRKWESEQFSECEMITEKMLIFLSIQYHLCNCNMADRQIY